MDFSRVSWAVHGKRVTREQFERAYAERSGMTVEQLRVLGRTAQPCNCGDNLCEGWQMIREGQ